MIFIQTIYILGGSYVWVYADIQVDIDWKSSEDTMLSGSK